jgi:glycosyltransferase involved in cell wall biosynthesis
MTETQAITENAAASNPSLVVVMPAYNAEAVVGECLDALLAAGFSPGDITVVDDGSQDRTGEIVATRGVILVRNETTQRPAEARNRGVVIAGGDIILFVDSDVCVHHDIRLRLLNHMVNPDITGVIGCYDDDPRSQSIVGRYRNLLHAYTHQHARGEVPTFWTGLGAIRREAFEGAGCFLSAWENIEDVELGLRVTAHGGRILLDPDIKGKHLKDWSVKSMFKTDLFGRAIPWTRLLLSGRMPVGILSTTLDKRVSAAVIVLGALFLITGFFWPLAFYLFAICTIIFIVMNVGLIRFLTRSGGPWFTLCSVPLHAIHHIAGLLGYAKVVLFESSGRSRDG